MKKKIAYVANIRFPSERAHSVQIAHMCNAYSENGMEVDLIVNTRVLKSKEETDIFFKLETLFNIKHLHGRGTPTTPLSFYFNEFIFALSCIFLGKLKQYNFVISRSEILLSVFTLIISSNKLIWESHDGHQNLLTKYLGFRGVNAIFTTIGQFDLQQNMFKKSLLAPNGITQDFYEVKAPLQANVRSELCLERDKKIVMYIGGFDKWKGIETLFESDIFLDEVQLVVIGGTEMEVLEKTKKYPTVKFLGYRPYHELFQNQQAADILVIPNTAKNIHSEKFTSPLKLFAHMASGIPLIASDIPSIKSLVNSDATFFEPDNPKDLARAINEVFSNYENKVQQALKLKERSKEFTWKRRAQKVMDSLMHDNTFADQ